MCPDPATRGSKTRRDTRPDVPSISGRAIDATTGLPFENLAEPGPEPGGLYAVPTVLNWHEQAASGTSGGNVRLTFTGKLQRTDSLTAPNWQDVAGAVSPLEVTPEEARFFRTVAE